MHNKILKIVLLSITYTFVLLILIFRFDYISGIMANFGGILQPVFIGLAVAFILTKPVNFFKGLLNKAFKGKHTKLSLGLSILIIYLLLLALISLLFGLVVPSLARSVSDLTSNIGTYVDNLEALVSSIPITPDMIEIFNSGYLQQLLTGVAELLQTLITGFVPELLDVTISIGSTVSNIFFGLILSIYILADADHLKTQVKRLINAYLPKKIGERILKISRVSEFVFSKYVVGQLTEAFILGCLCYIGMSIFRFEYAMLISVIIGVTNIIPIIGPIVGAIPSAFILLVVDPMSAVWFLVFIIVLQQIESNVIYPRVVGGSVGLPGPFVLSGVLIGGGLFGAVGMILALPTLSVIYQLVKINVEDVEEKQRGEHEDNNEEKQNPDT